MRVRLRTERSRTSAGLNAAPFQCPSSNALHPRGRGAPSQQAEDGVRAERKRRPFASRETALRGQPQERQHSAAAGGTRDRLPSARGSNSGFATRWYQFCICDIVSTVCMSMHGVRIFIERFKEDDMAKKAKKARKTTKAATKKVAKKTSKKKKKVQQRTNCRLRATTRAQSDISPKDLKCLFPTARCRVKACTRPDLCAAGCCVKVRPSASAGNSAWQPP